MPSKYQNKKVEVDGIKFDSKKEARHYGLLKLRERAGEIYDLVIQPPFSIEVNGHKICDYRADFSYVEKDRPDETVVVDVKSPITAKNPVYRLKKKLMKAVHGVGVVEA